MTKNHVDILDMTFSPSRAGCISGVSPAIQRLWRSRGICVPVGIIDGKRVPFSFIEVAYLFCLREASKVGMKLTDADMTATFMATAVTRHLRFRHHREMRFVASFNHRDGSLSHAFVDDGDVFPELPDGGHSFLLFDCFRIAERIVERVEE